MKVSVTKTIESMYVWGLASFCSEKSAESKVTSDIKQ